MATHLPFAQETDSNFDEQSQKVVDELSGIMTDINEVTNQLRTNNSKDRRMDKVLEKMDNHLHSKFDTSNHAA